MRVSDEKLTEVMERGFTIVEGFLEGDTLREAQEALWTIYPRPEEYFEDPSRHPKFASNQFAGLEVFPYPAWALNRLTVHPDLVDAAERLLETKNLEIYKVELWAKYSGAINYDQNLHRDFMNHTLVAPRPERPYTQMTTFLLLSDVTEHDGPTKLVPLEHSRGLPLFPEPPLADLREHEVPAVGPAGTLLIYKTDVVHRGSDFTLPQRSRFTMLVDFQARGCPWNGKMSWPGRGNNRHMAGALTPMTPRERDLFGWPPPGNAYWTAQTLRDVALRYPNMDLSPYAARVPSEPA